MELVRIKKEYLNPKEKDILYFVKEDNGDRLFISPLNCDYAIRSTELVRRYMVEHVTESK